MTNREITLITKKEAAPASFWDKVERISKALAVIALPFILGAIGYIVQLQIEAKKLVQEQNELQKTYLDLAVDIVRNKELIKRPELKKWANEIIRKFSPVPVDKATDFTLVDFVIDYRFEGQPKNQVRIATKEGTQAIALPGGCFIFKDPNGEYLFLYRDSSGNITIKGLIVQQFITLDELKNLLNQD